MTAVAPGAGSDREPAHARSEAPLLDAPLPSSAEGRPGAERGRLWLVRHGETEWSRVGRHTSHTDLPLTDRGERQAAALTSLLRPRRPAQVRCSPRARAVRTAELAGLTTRASSASSVSSASPVGQASPADPASPAGVPISDIPAIVTDPELAEWDYGEYEGRTTAQIQAIHPGWTIWTGAPPPAGESVADVGRRADRVLARLRVALRDGDVVLVGHGHFSRVLTARWLGLPAAAGALFVLRPAAPCVLGWEHDTPAVVHWNLVAADDLTDPEDL